MHFGARIVQSGISTVREMVTEPRTV